MNTRGMGTTRTERFKGAFGVAVGIDVDRPLVLALPCSEEDYVPGNGIRFHS